jgi:hypothetical protein
LLLKIHELNGRGDLKWQGKVAQRQHFRSSPTAPCVLGHSFHDCRAAAYRKKSDILVKNRIFLTQRTWSGVGVQQFAMAWERDKAKQALP